MGRRSALLRAELELAELEESFVAAKEAGTVTYEDKVALREARRRFRILRAGQPPADGAVRPAAVTAGVEVPNE